ncbi:Capsular glucan synthase [Novipirellula aureliae]|uniref:Capsular glucan synthase n=1 Tax=Novipirellula aureliae TaxID=2527966 RepID=A0A5C6EA05_9BACT|nr:glycosyltransferase [Novipirellula aureliae]TWU44326.1 Capsular glucan synthase [Novipirellula aureliae]
MHKMQVAGAEVLVKQIIERLAGQIHSTIFCLDGLGELGQQLLDDGTPVVVLNREPGMDLKMAKRLDGEVRSRGIDVLHAHQYTPFFYSAIARLRYRTPVKVLFTEHGRHYPDIVSAKRRWANRLLLHRYADTATACCDFSTRALQNIEGFPLAMTLQNGVDLDQLPPRGDAATQAQLRESLGLVNGRKYVACVGRFHSVKDHATLIRAWERVHNHLPDAKLLLVGDGPERANIEAQIQQSDASFRAETPSTNFANSIELLGIRHDVAAILRAVDLFTLTSISEAASLTLLEAMASECASVLTDVGGNAEHMRSGVDGYLAPRGDDAKLAEAIVDLLSDPAKCQRFGKSARQRVQEHFDLDKVIQQYGEHYRQLSRA